MICMILNGTQTNRPRFFFPLFILLTFFSTAIFAQPDFDFRNKTFVSGNDLQVGAVYRYLNVKPGLDALLTISDITPGVTVSELDGTSGYPEAIQPTIQVPPHTKGYLEMSVQFVLSGTSLPIPQLLVAVTPIDVDGLNNYDGAGHGLYEFDEINLHGGLFDFNLFGGELVASQINGWFVGKNVGGVDYPSRDTAAKAVMFTAFNLAISDFVIRVGVDNQSNNSASRLRSVYMGRFNYPNSILAAPSLVSFNGVSKEQQVALQWQLSAHNGLREVMIERSENAKVFATVGKVAAEMDAVGHYNFTDNSPTRGNLYYRLKLISVTGSVQYSNVLVFRSEANSKERFKMYPSVINDNATVIVAAKQQEQASLQVTDLGGRVVYQRNINLQAGNNNVSVNGFGSLHPGTYVAVIRLGSDLYNQKIMIQ
jgi:hypothetical protein